MAPSVVVKEVAASVALVVVLVAAVGRVGSSARTTLKKSDIFSKDVCPCREVAKSVLRGFPGEELLGGKGA